MSHDPLTIPTRRPALQIAVGIVLALFITFAFYEFGRHFLLIEYRQQIEIPHLFNPLRIFDPATLFDDATMSVAFSRAFFLLTNRSIALVCGYGLLCHNAFHIGLLAASGGLYAAVLARLFPTAPVWIFIAGLVFMLASMPVMDALAWQATVLDKLSMLLTAACLLVVASIDLERRRPLALGVMNLVLLLLVVVAHNSKEATFSLVPSLLLLLAARQLATAPRLTLASIAGAVWRSAAWLVLPLAYSMFHVSVVLYSRLVLNTAEGSRVMGGSMSFNFTYYSRYLFNADLDHPVSGRTWIGVALAGVLLLAAVACAAASRRNRASGLLLAWAVVCFAAAFTIPLRTTATPPFYLLTPLLYLSIAVSIALLIVHDTLPSRPGRLVLAAASCGFLLVHVIGLVRSYSLYERLVAMSSNFKAALGELGAAVARTPDPVRISIHWPGRERRAYMFIGNTAQRRLTSYVLPAGTSRERLDALDHAIADQAYSSPFTPPPPQPGEIVMVLADRLRLESIAGPPTAPAP